MFSFISSVSVFASENIFTDGTELDSYENKKTNLYNVDNTANENDFISEIEESEMSKTVFNEENIDPKELHAFNYNYINGIMNASDVSLYSDVWAIIPTTSGNKTVYSTANHCETNKISLTIFHFYIHPFTNFAVPQQFHLLFFWQNSCYIHEAFQFQEPLHLLFQDTIPCIFYEDYNVFLQRLYH